MLRMIATGVFDRHPGLRLIIGHCGEMLPFMLARVDAMLHVDHLAMAPSGYFGRNIWVTTSGLFSLPPVMCTVQVLGMDRVLFSVDYPFGAQRGRPRHARHAAAQPAGQGQDRGRQRRARAGPAPVAPVGSRHAR